MYQTLTNALSYETMPGDKPKLLSMDSIGVAAIIGNIIIHTALNIPVGKFAKCHL